MDNKINSLPVYNTALKKYTASIDIHDISIVIFVLAVTKSFTDLFAQEVATWHEFENEDFQFFAKEGVEKFCNASMRNFWKTVSDSTPVLELIKILGNPAQNSELQSQENVRRVGVENQEGKLVGLISQFELVKFLLQEAKKSGLFSKLKLNDVPKVKEQTKLFIIKENEHAIEAFKMMLENAITGLGVVDESGHLTSVFSSSDIKREKASQELFTDLQLTVKEYLSKSKRYFKKEIDEKILQIGPNDPFISVLEKMVKNHLHQIFELDANKAPVKEYSLCDFIRMFL